MKRVLPFLSVLLLLSLLSMSGRAQGEFTLTFDQPSDGELVAYTGDWQNPIYHTSGARLAADTEITFEYKPTGMTQVDHWVINGENVDPNSSAFFVNEKSIRLERDTHISIVTRKAPSCIVRMESPEGTSIDVTYGEPSRRVENGGEVPQYTFLSIMPNIPDETQVVDYFEVNGERQNPGYGGGTSYYVQDKTEITIKMIVKTAPKQYNITRGEVNDFTMGSLEISYMDPTYNYKRYVYSSETLPEGIALTCEASPQAGYKVDQWLVNDEPISETGNIYTHTLTADATISVNFVEEESAAITKYPIHFIQPDHGSLSALYYGDTGVVTLVDGDSVPAGTWVSFQASPETGYAIDKWIVNGEEIAPYTDDIIRNKYSIQIVDKGVELQVIFKRSAMRTITYSTPEHATSFEAHKTFKTGDLIASGSQVEDGSNVVAIVKPEKGYVVEHWLVNGEIVTREITSSKRNQKNILADKDLQLSALLRLSGHIITYTDPAHAKLSLTYTEPMEDAKNPIENNMRIPEGSFLFASVSDLEPGWVLDYYLVNGERKDQIDNMKALVGTIDIQAVLRKATANYTVKVATEGLGGFVSGSFINESGNKNSIFGSGREVPAGTEITCVAAPNSGYVVDQWKLNGVIVADSELSADRNTYKFTVEDNSDVKVTFKIVESESKAVVHIQQPEHGTISCAYIGDDGADVPVVDGAEINTGTFLTFTIELEEGYELDKWIINGEEKQPVLEGGRYSIRLTGELTISARLTKSLQNFTITYEDNKNGTVEVRATDVDKTLIESGASVVEGTEVLLIARPKEGYEFDKWIFNGEVQEFFTTPETRITIEQNMTIKATFKQTGSVGSVLARDIDYTLTSEEITCVAAELIVLYTIDGELVTQTQGTCLDIRHLPSDRYILALHTVDGVGHVKIVL